MAASRILAVVVRSSSRREAERMVSMLNACSVQRQSLQDAGGCDGRHCRAGSGGSEQTIGCRVRESVEVSVEDLRKRLLGGVGPEEQSHRRTQLLRIDRPQYLLRAPS